jgi:hypothetical protein
MAKQIYKKLQEQKTGYWVNELTFEKSRRTSA